MLDEQARLVGHVHLGPKLGLVAVVTVVEIQVLLGRTVLHQVVQDLVRVDHLRGVGAAALERLRQSE